VPASERVSKFAVVLPDVGLCPQITLESFKFRTLMPPEGGLTGVLPSAFNTTPKL